MEDILDIYEMPYDPVIPVVCMDENKRKIVYEYFSEEELFWNKHLIFERQKQQALNDRKEKKIQDEKYRRVMQSVQNALENCSRQAASVAKNLKDKMHTVKSMEHRFVKEDENMTEMPEQEEVIFFKLGDKNSYIPAGKTTLLRKIAEELINRNDIKAEYMPQNYEVMLNLDVTPVDFLDRFGDKEERTRIRTYLGSLKYTTDEMDHPIRELSGGQKAKVLLLNRRR